MAAVRRRGGKWQARVKRCGVAVEKSFISRKDAERWARATEADIEAGRYAPPAKAPPKAPESLADLFARYRNEVAQRHRSRTTIFNLEALAQKLGGVLLSDLNAQVIARWRDDRIKEVKAASVVRELHTLSAVLNVARKEWCYDLVNVVEAIKRPAQGQGRTRRLAPGEEAAILEELAPPYRRIVRFALATAMRRGEILALTWKNVDMGERVAVLQMTKNGESRRVPLSPEALAVLREQAAEKTQAIDGRVFAMPAITLDSAWRRACARAGVEDLHFHDLRREAVTRLLERGFSVAEAAAVSGHKTWGMLRRYSALRAEALAVKLA